LSEDKLDELRNSLTASRHVRLKRMGLAPVNIDGEVMVNAELLQALNYSIMAIITPFTSVTANM
jgi:hypothetical protein